MKTLILNGSPRPQGDTASLLGHLTPLLTGEVRRIDAYRSGIHACIDCRYCWEKPGCALYDPMEELLDELDSFTGILIASPVYFSGLTPPLLAIGSRLQTLFVARRFRGEVPLRNRRRGAVLLVGGGDGSPLPAYGTSTMFLRLMKATDIYPLVSSHATDTLPALDDPAVVAGVEGIAAWLCGKERETSPQKCF